MRVGRVGFEPLPPLPLHNMSCGIERKLVNIYYVNITVTNINKTRLVNMVIFRDFNFRDYEKLRPILL